MRYISDSAKIGSNVEFGYFVVIEDDVVIGDNCKIGHNVVIKTGSIIGNNVEISDGTIIGKFPQKALTSKTTEDVTFPPAFIEDGVKIGANSIVYRGAHICKNVYIADLVTIRENVKIGEYTIIGRGVSIENKTTIGSYCKIETNAYITAISDIEDWAFIAPCVVTSNDNFAGRGKDRIKYFKGVTVKRGGRIGANATILPGKVIGEEGFVGAGSVVTKDVRPRKIVVGNPARELRDVPSDQLLENQ
ncbi:transferase hexapeptide repeat containing protein [Caldicellulosiruptor saccharolyticus DSM 8903]|uniref:Transferase hexapeptide repeat containing protein n=1 Tax=Caldicellulosiruptor saccharolyticus (strain ATCC 43494 / DSM 8903 / Tp8T 6331) TaxID=351627 RepID=A4XKF5_CALS8|nr:N-acetyltransferase [Caldicellulosiruptor saccharolyticus]ABP67390.1 transferase hexapeptide repeat containing protein [Caldicellulosiruptor saccharolyticus DSM 8903]